MIQPHPGDPQQLRSNLSKPPPPYKLPGLRLDPPDIGNLSKNTGIVINPRLLIIFLLDGADCLVHLLTELGEFEGRGLNYLGEMDVAVLGVGGDLGLG